MRQGSDWRHAANRMLPEVGAKALAAPSNDPGTSLLQRRRVIRQLEVVEDVAGELNDPDNDYLWVASIWEEHADLGPLYSMVTTASSPLISPIHEGMPGLLRAEEMQQFLAGNDSWDFQPFAGPLVVTPCESPLAKRRSGGVQQGELF